MIRTPILHLDCSMHSITLSENQPFCKPQFVGVVFTPTDSTLQYMYERTGLSRSTTGVHNGPFHRNNHGTRSRNSTSVRNKDTHTHKPERGSHMLRRGSHMLRRGSHMLRRGSHILPSNGLPRTIHRRDLRTIHRRNDHQNRRDRRLVHKRGMEQLQRLQPHKAPRPIEAFSYCPPILVPHI